MPGSALPSLLLLARLLADLMRLVPASEMRWFRLQAPQERLPPPPLLLASAASANTGAACTSPTSSAASWVPPPVLLLGLLLLLLPEKLLLPLGPGLGLALLPDACASLAARKASARALTDSPWGSRSGRARPAALAACAACCFASSSPWRSSCTLCISSWAAPEGSAAAVPLPLPLPPE
jgi:hypothetical protein